MSESWVSNESSACASVRPRSPILGRRAKRYVVLVTKPLNSGPISISYYILRSDGSPNTTYRAQGRKLLRRQSRRFPRSTQNRQDFGLVVAFQRNLRLERLDLTPFLSRGYEFCHGHYVGPPHLASWPCVAPGGAPAESAPSGCSNPERRQGARADSKCRHQQGWELTAESNEVTPRQLGFDLGGSGEHSARLARRASQGRSVAVRLDQLVATRDVHTTRGAFPAKSSPFMM